MNAYSGLGRNFEATMEILINLDKIYEKATKMFEKRKIVGYFINKCHKLNLFFMEEEGKIEKKKEKKRKKKNGKIY